VNETAVVEAINSCFKLIVPEIILAFVACVLFVGASFRVSRHVWGTVALVGLVGAGIALVFTPLLHWTSLEGAQASIDAAPFNMDTLGWYIKAVALVGGAVLVLCSWNEVPDQQAGEYHACLLLTVAGLSLTGIANDLVTLFLSLELISIPTYVLLYLPRHTQATQEAAVKYFMLSVFTSALLLFGFSYLYGLTGTTNISALMQGLNRVTENAPKGLPAVGMIALVMVVAGLCFKVTAVPFHFYAPDVYQGAPTSAAALLAFVPKAAGFVAFIRVLGFTWSGHAVNVGLSLGSQAPILLWILSAVTMSLGNVLALLQHNVKRLLAYSSVAHAGYMLIGLTAANQLSRDPHYAWVGVSSVLFYIAAYGAMTIGAFGVLLYLSSADQSVETEDDLAGLSQTHPGAAALMALFLFSLIGIPGTAGFAGKWNLIFGTMAADTSPSMLFRWLAIIGIVNSAIGAWYYLRIVARMYLQPPVQALPRRSNAPVMAALWICGLVTLWAGVYPNSLLQQTNRAAGTLEPTPAVGMSTSK